MSFLSLSLLVAGAVAGVALAVVGVVAAAASSSAASAAAAAGIVVAVAGSALFVVGKWRVCRREGWSDFKVAMC